MFKVVDRAVAWGLECQEGVWSVVEEGVEHLVLGMDSRQCLWDMDSRLVGVASLPLDRDHQVPASVGSNLLHQWLVVVVVVV